MEIDTNLFPDHHLNKTKEEEKLRQETTDRLMKEFTSIYKQHQWNKDNDDDVPATLFYWSLSKQQRARTNLERPMNDGFMCSSERNMSNWVLQFGEGYMNILWEYNNKDLFCLYVGKSINLKNRITDHQNQLFRRRQKSLH
ncbi:hypothetical protein T310_9571 [Rasamsonia emersonii CBS 393.64]|uniref:GIY-YIG domain-containing protein n=1 Tax=Rasamsonia emersonii (strain ATCC 16479 / CBS 393.64 / IMI 116815) TaxID=1408163 RepID=A0A0F4YFC8_RASE3|nr:hypothetical protein T310_9571 [Rasamsonia emersonii CBS 393.64]KKA16854.1 hypothetical protein T310_9571 [Rasamsonia emersonii CBS 393.64]